MSAVRAARRTVLTAPPKRGGRVRDRTQSKDTTPRNDQDEPRGDDDDERAPDQLKANFDVQEIVDAQMRVASVDVKIPCVLAGVERSSGILRCSFSHDAMSCAVALHAWSVATSLCQSLSTPCPPWMPACRVHH